MFHGCDDKWIGKNNCHSAEFLINRTVARVNVFWVIKQLDHLLKIMVKCRRSTGSVCTLYHEWDTQGCSGTIAYCTDDI